MADTLEMKVIAHIRTDFPTKFGIPRQSGVVEEAMGAVIFEPEYRNPDALRGLEGFSHLWLIWQFSAAVRDTWSPTVRPPRLGGNTRMGVFATRSPFRPNAIGLSCVKLVRVVPNGPDGPAIVVSGVDLMKEMIRVAAGEPLSVKQEDIHLQGHAMECRINAEDPAHHFRPCPGVIEAIHLPGGNGVRIDTAAYNGYEIPPFYDSMIAKVIVHGRTRQEAIDKMRSTLGELIIDGVTTNVDFQYEILDNEDFQAGEITTDFIPMHFNL